MSYVWVQLNYKCDCQLSKPFIVKKPFWSRLGSVMCLWTWAPKTMNSEPPSVNCKWVLKNWHSHLGSTSYPSQTNEAPVASKWDWSPFEIRHRTLGLRILRKVPLSMETQSRATLPPHPIFHWSDVETKTQWSFSTSSIFTHSSWILAANSRLYYWMDALLCHCEECLEWNLKLEQNNSQFLWTSVAATYIYIFHLMMENFSIFLCRFLALSSQEIGQGWMCIVYSSQSNKEMGNLLLCWQNSLFEKKKKSINKKDLILSVILPQCIYYKKKQKEITAPEKSNVMLYKSAVNKEV